MHVVDLSSVDVTLGMSLARRLGALHVAEWGRLYNPAEWNVAIAVDEFTAMREPSSVDRTLVAFDGEPSPTTFVGSVSLLETDDLSGWGHVRPWVASLLVVPDWRGRGVGALLTRAAVDLAALRGDPYVHLFTPHHAEYYERLGWRVVGSASAHGDAVVVMGREAA